MPPASFDVRVSKVFVILLLTIHISSVWIILSCPGYSLGKWLVFVLCLVSFFWNLNCQWEIKKIFWDEKEGWKVQDRNGKIYSKTIKRKNMCTPWMVGLSFQRKPLVIFFDSMEREAFRRLKVLVLNQRKV